MKTPTPDQVARLPKWARDYVERLERDRDQAVRERDEARLATDPDGSAAVVDPYGDPPIGLGKRVQVRFRADGPAGTRSHDSWAWIDATSKVDVVTGRRYVEVLGGTGLLVEPQASNVVRVYLSR